MMLLFPKNAAPLLNLTVTSQETLMADCEGTRMVHLLPPISSLPPLIDQTYCLSVTWAICWVGAWHVKVIFLSTQISPFGGRLTEMVTFIFNWLSNSLLPANHQTRLVTLVLGMN